MTAKQEASPPRSHITPFQGCDNGEIIDVALKTVCTRQCLMVMERSRNAPQAGK